MVLAFENSLLMFPRQNATQFESAIPKHTFPTIHSIIYKFEIVWGKKSYMMFNLNPVIEHDKFNMWINLSKTRPLDLPQLIAWANTVNTLK